MEDIGTTTGEVRWTGPGHPYGPEYNDDNEVMFSVLGFECKPEEGDPPKVLSKCKKNYFHLHAVNTIFICQNLLSLLEFYCAGMH